MPNAKEIASKIKRDSNESKSGQPQKKNTYKNSEEQCGIKVRRHFFSVSTAKINLSIQCFDCSALADWVLLIYRNATSDCAQNVSRTQAHHRKVVRVCAWPIEQQKVRRACNNLHNLMLYQRNKNSSISVA